MAKLVIPNIFTPGTPAQASQMNANFEAISNWSASGQIDTDSIKIPLVARSNDNQGQPQPILRFVQTIDQPIMELQNAEGEASIKITQSEELDAGVGIIHIIDDIAQTQANSAAIKLALSDNATMPAISINHDAIQTLSLTKSEFRLIDSTFKVNATQMLIPRVTTGNRPAAAEEGSVLYNSTTKQLNEKKAASGGWAPVGAPVGSILMWPTATAPEGWLLCNGDAVTNGSGTIQSVTADFSALYAVLNNADWNGNLPDLRGAFVRGSGTNSFSPGSPGVTQTGPALGDWQDDATALNGIAAQTSGSINVGNTSSKDLNHNHAIGVSQGGTFKSVAGDVFGNQGSDFEVQIDPSDTNDNMPWVSANTDLNHRHTITSSDSETRPFSIGLNYIIKY